MIRMHLNCYNRLRMKLRSLQKEIYKLRISTFPMARRRDLDEIQQHRERIKENGIALTGINTGMPL